MEKTKKPKSVKSLIENKFGEVNIIYTESDIIRGKVIAEEGTLIVVERVKSGRTLRYVIDTTNVCVKEIDAIGPALLGSMIEVNIEYPCIRDVVGRITNFSDKTIELLSIKRGIEHKHSFNVTNGSVAIILSKIGLTKEEMRRLGLPKAEIQKILTSTQKTGA